MKERNPELFTRQRITNGMKKAALVKSSQPIQQLKWKGSCFKLPVTYNLFSLFRKTNYIKFVPWYNRFKFNNWHADVVFVCLSFRCQFY